MAFLRVEKKKSGTYLRIVESYKDNGKSRHRTLHSLGKVENYPPHQLERIATKLLELAGCSVEDILGAGLKEISRVNYGYALVVKKLWKLLSLEVWMRKVNYKRRIKFNWLSAFELMIAERINEPCSKLATHGHQMEYIGFGSEDIKLHHFYRTLDVLSEEQESLKKHLFKKQQSLFSSQLDVVFYDVTTLYFDSQRENEGALTQKGYSKDGKAHKTQIVLGLLVDKFRNPISYKIYKGNTYEGKTMQDALASLQKQYTLDRIVVVADSAMIDKANRDLIDSNSNLTYILGDRIKNLPKKISTTLINPENHKPLNNRNDNFTYSTLTYQGRKIICTYSEKRARKDRFSREKLIEKAEQLLNNPSKLKQSKKRGAGRFITQIENENYQLDAIKIKEDAQWDGYKAIATTSNLPIQQVLSKYSDLFEVEHAFRTLKSQLEIRPVYHWTNKRIEGHIAMCFTSYTIFNYIRNITGLQNKQIVRALDKMQLSKIQEESTNQPFYLRSAICQNQATIINRLKLIAPKDCTPQSTVNQYLT